MRMNVLEDLADTGAAPSSCGCSCERSCRCHIPHLSVPPSPMCDLDMYHAILESQPSNTDVLSPYRVDQSPSVRHKRSLHARLKRVRTSAPTSIVLLPLHFSVLLCLLAGDCKREGIAIVRVGHLPGLLLRVLRC
jgi:hypothetical protein